MGDITDCLRRVGDAGHVEINVESHQVVRLVIDRRQEGPGSRVEWRGHWVSLGWTVVVLSSESNVAVGAVGHWAPRRLGARIQTNDAIPTTVVVTDHLVQAGILSRSTDPGTHGQSRNLAGIDVERHGPVLSTAEDTSAASQAASRVVSGIGQRASTLECPAITGVVLGGCRRIVERVEGQQRVTGHAGAYIVGELGCGGVITVKRGGRGEASNLTTIVERNLHDAGGSGREGSGKALDRKMCRVKSAHGDPIDLERFEKPTVAYSKGQCLHLWQFGKILQIGG